MSGSSCERSKHSGHEIKCWHPTMNAGIMGGIDEPPAAAAQPNPRRYLPPAHSRPFCGSFLALSPRARCLKDSYTSMRLLE